MMKILDPKGNSEQTSPLPQKTLAEPVAHGERCSTLGVRTMAQDTVSQHDLRVRFQFSMRTLYVMVLVAGVLIVLLAPFIRGLSVLQQQYFFACVTIDTVLAFAVMVGMSVRRRRAERKAGNLLLRTSPLKLLPHLRIGYAFIPFFYLGLCGWIVFIGTMKVRSGFTGPDYVVTASFILMWAMHVPVYFTRLWWRISPVSLEICENGFIYGGLRFTLWDQIQRFHWSEKKSHVLVVQLKRTKRELTTHHQYKAEIERLFAAHVASS